MCVRFTEREEETKIFNPLVNSANGFSDCSWANQTTGARSFLPALSSCCREPSSWAVICSFPKYIVRKQD